MNKILDILSFIWMDNDINGFLIIFFIISFLVTGSLSIVAIYGNKNNKINIQREKNKQRHEFIMSCMDTNKGLKECEYEYQKIRLMNK